jgi:hypothetical protein
MTIDDVTSGSQATSGHAQWYILYYYYSKKKGWELVAHAHAIISGHVTSEWWDARMPNRKLPNNHPIGAF